MALSPSLSPMRKKKLRGNLLSIQNSKVCYDRKQIAFNDEEDATIAEFESALKEMNVTNMSKLEQTLLIRKYNTCFKRINYEKGVNGQSEPDLKQILGIVKDWAPKTDLICLYVRWAKKLKSNFHLDSIATLLTVAKQCGYSPLEFLNVKTLQVLPRRGKKMTAGRYGVSFSFVKTRNEKENFTHQFTGFLVTLSLLESSVVGSRAVNGKVGMRQSQPRTPSQMFLPTGDGNEKTVVQGIPTTEFHKGSSLYHRVWSDIHHRWIALRVIQHLSKETGVLLDDPAALQYSFQMNAEAGRVRFDWLDSIVGICLRFPNANSIASNKTELAKLWLDARSFHSRGTAELRNIQDEAMYEEMAATFRQLQCLTRAVTFERRCLHKWLILRGYAFNLWLDATKNEELKSKLTDTFSTSTTKKRKQSAVVSKNHLPPLAEKQRKKSNDPSFVPLTMKEADELLARRDIANNSTEMSGLSSLLGSRKDLSPLSYSKADRHVAIHETDK
jgi:hypothetical protein